MLEKCIGRKRLRVSREKTEYLCFNGQWESEVWMQEIKLKCVKGFRYLGSHISADGNLDVKVNHRIQSGCKNWKRTTGAFCDHKIGARV